MLVLASILLFGQACAITVQPRLAQNGHEPVIGGSTSSPSESPGPNFISRDITTKPEQIINTDTCDLLRKSLTGVSNEKTAGILSRRLHNSKESCVIMSICKLHETEHNECGPMVDAIGTCFLPTPSGQIASTSCPASVSGIPYDAKKNVTRLCRENGEWAAKSNYTDCKPLNPGCIYQKMTKGEMDSELEKRELDSCMYHTRNLEMISYVGRGLALFTLIISFGLFWVLKSIRCWRNIIHWHLIASFILRNIFWISLRLFINYQSRRSNTVFCRILVTIFQYTQATNYFWMFVEGLYLHMMVVLAYSHDRIKLGVYLAIGWGIPMPLTLVWAIMKYRYEDNMCWMSNAEQSKMADYFIQIPILTILVINALILGNVVRILFTKLRAGYVSGGVAEATQFTKAVKAAVFLFPLLGVTYVIFFISPATESSGQIVFLYFNTFLQSFQGFFVCLIYCFANNEVQRAFVKKMHSWRWQMRWQCCFHRRKEAGLNRRISSASLSRTNNTMVNLRTRDVREFPPSGILKKKEVVGTATSTLPKLKKENENLATAKPEHSADMEVKSLSCNTLRETATPVNKIDIDLSASQLLFSEQNTKITRKIRD